jgi:hypothetical protein
MQTAQSYHDEQGYREASAYWDDEGPMTIEQAEEESEELIEANPCEIACWLAADSAIKADGPVDVPAASRRFQAGDELTDGELLALIWRAGDDCKAAAYTLKNRFLECAKTKARIKELAIEMMPEEEVEE